MRTWIKGGVLVAVIYLLIQFIDDFLLVFYSITPLEKVRYLIYFDFLNLYDPLVSHCYGWFEPCSILYIVVLGFIVGAIIGGIVGMFNKEGRTREILKEMDLINKGKAGEISRGGKEEKKRWLKKREEKKEEEKKARLQEEESKRLLKEREEEVPEIEIIPLKGIKRKNIANSKSREKGRKNKRQ